MTGRLPVVAAIPNYNMAEGLRHLLPQVLEQGYDEVYVLDDASTDNSAEVVQQYETVKWVPGDENLGPGGNRNRIIPHLGQEAIIHFLDADVKLLSRDNPDTLRTLFASDQKLGLIGGLIQLPDGTSWMFNYGPRYSLYSMVSGWSQALVAQLAPHHRHMARTLDAITHWRLKSYPDPTKRPQARDVFWVGEANMAIPASLYKKVGGFDESLRYHEAQDLAFKLSAEGLKVKFIPTLVVEHQPIDLGDLERRAIQSKAGWQLIKKYGLHFK